MAVENPATTFADVAGVEEAKEELAEVVEFLRCPERYAALGARLPKGLLMAGPPGTGKTLLARAVAGEAGVPFLRVCGSQFVEMYVGVGAARVRELFARARKSAPCLVFIDEIDAVGRRRGTGLGGNEERDQTLNQILVEMDGFEASTNIVVLAATNRPDVLDPALTRAGRFDRHIALDLPDSRARLEMLRLHARGKPLGEGVDLEALAKLTPGLAGADLENLLNEAALLAARRHSPAIEQMDLQEAVDRVVAGPRRQNRVISAQERFIAACHEAGHAVVAHALPSVGPVHKVSIVSRGSTGGYTRVAPAAERYLLTGSELRETLAWALGGTAAERMVIGETSTGASNDIQRATAIARRMVTEYGMSERLGPVALGGEGAYGSVGYEAASGRLYGSEVAAMIDREVRRLVGEALGTARAILAARRGALLALIEALLAEESLAGEPLRALLDAGGSTAPAMPPAAERVGECAPSGTPVGSRGLRTLPRWQRGGRSPLRLRWGRGWFQRSGSWPSPEPALAGDEARRGRRQYARPGVSSGAGGQDLALGRRERECQG